MMLFKYKKNIIISTMVRWWLLSGVVLIFIQVFIGGITRLTGSGLSITKWEIVIGTLPPLNEIEWSDAFELYKGTPQYQKINQGMSLGEFKFIYFWEYFHRLWARIMGFVFLIPFIFFLVKGNQPKWLIKRLVVIFLWACLVAAFGWVMVASGLKDRPWVNAYNLTIHLCLAIGLMGYIFWTYLLMKESPNVGVYNKVKRLYFLIFVLICIQIFLGGIVSGMHAALSFPSWPLMNGQIVPFELLVPENWTFDNFSNYDQHSFMAALIQFMHRMNAYLIFVLIVYMNLRIYKIGVLPNSLIVIDITLCIQIILGVLILLKMNGSVPIWYGVLHQSFAMLLFLSGLFILYNINRNVKLRLE